MMKQKAKIEDNEEGTKAAAVTVEEDVAIGVNFYKYFYATRPFVYYIMEKNTGAIYFMGTYCFDDTGEQVTIKEPLEEREPVLGRHDFTVEMPKRSEDEIFKSVEQMPQFPGGEAALMEHLDSHIQYPPEAAKQGIQGKVIVQFVVDKTGKVGEVKVVRSVNKALDDEAVRLIKTLPKFYPGRQNGQAIAVWYTVPVTFKLQDKQEPEKPKDVEVKAEFPGGEEALSQFLKDQIKYPPKVAKKRIQGRVEVAFWIDKSGKVHDVKVVESVDKDLDKEVVRVCKQLPDFIPATVNGEPVEVLFKLPIRFKIPGLKTQYLRTVQIDAK